MRLKGRQQRSLSRCRARQGGAIVELALIVPLLATVILGICETGQVLRVHMVLTAAARKGCAVGCQPGGSNAEVKQVVQSVLSASKLPTTATVTVMVNDSEQSVATAKPQDKVAVRVAIPTAEATWTGSYVFFGRGSLRSEMVVMLKLG